MKTLFEYTTFWWKAKGRHGTHSPFAYLLVDQVRKIKINEKNKSLSVCKQLAAHFYYPIFTQLQESCQHPKPLIFFVNTALTMNELSPLIDGMHPDSLIVVPKIHRSATKHLWEKLCQHPDLHFSADLWHTGLISKKPGQAKAHFRLKWCIHSNNM